MAYQRNPNDPYRFPDDPYRGNAAAFEIDQPNQAA